MDIDVSGNRIVILGMYVPASDGTPEATPDIITTATWVKTLDAATGELLWVTDTAPAATSLIAAPDSVTIISINQPANTSAETAGQPNTLTRLDLSTGQPTGWTWTAEDDALGGVTLSPDGSLLFIGTRNGNLLVVETSASSTVEPVIFPVSQQTIMGSPVITNDLVLVTARDGTLRAIPLASVINA
jgi:hypothetical protein